MRRPTLLSLAATVAALGLAASTTSYAAGAASGGPASDVARHALRSGLTDQNFYFVMGDRFANGDTANDRGGLTGDRNVTGFDASSKAFYHGGDLDGLRSKLDYVKGLGTTAIWLTPIFKNKAVQLEDGPSAGYHGYWITDFTRVDPHLGTNKDLEELIAAAHAKGMKVFFDIITNHTADVIGYEEGARTAYVPKDVEPYRTASGRPFDDRDFAGTGHFPSLDRSTSFPYTPVLDPDEENLKKPDWLNDPRYYHNRGNTTFTGEDSQYGDFFGLDDLFTEHPQVQQGMTRIYESWVDKFGIDGFRIDTMKHVNDEFWQAFGPGIQQYAAAHGRPDFFMFGEVYDDRTDDAGAAFRSHYTTHDKMQSVLDFGFQMAARHFVSQSGSAQALADFFATDDWYTDADSNAYELPTFLGNHDMGRFGYFVKNDNPGASESEALARDTLGHELMYLSRGNPVVYYGDEQGFTGSGGDQLARQDMFANAVTDWPSNQDLDDLGSDATPNDDNFDASHPLYRTVRELADLTAKYPALRNGAQQLRYADAGPGVLAFSRLSRTQQREYLVGVNNSTTSRTVTVPTATPNSSWSPVWGSTTPTSSDGDAAVSLTVPPLSAVVYRAADQVPASPAAPSVALRSPQPSPESHGRMQVRADVGGRSFYEVTFQAKVGDGPWTTIGTDDAAPYRVFHDTSDLPTGTSVRYRAAVLDNAGHARMGSERQVTVAPPTVRLTSPADGGTVTSIDPVSLVAAVDPERATESVRFERKVGDGSWTTIATDTSSPVYTATDDVSSLPLGSTVRYRAVLVEDGTTVTSAPVRVRTAEPKPNRNSVTLVGSLESEATDDACPDWTPDCAAAHMTFDKTDGQWHLTTDLPEGDYEWKVAINDAWTENYGAGGASGGGNLTLSVPAGGATYTFTWNQVTHVPSVEESP